jgi:xanthine dehydrogenase accessory factor
MNFEEFLIEFEKAKETQESFVVVTLVGHIGSIPQEMGARLIVNSQGYFAGTVGGGKVEKAAIEHALKYLDQNTQKSFYHEWNLQKDLGMSCGGVVKLFFEIHHKKNNWNIILFGAGHVIQELSRILIRLDCQITCIDSRPEWLEKLPKDAKLTPIQNLEMKDSVENIKSEDFVIISTMGHSTDLPILEKILKSNLELSYLGVIGSDLKSMKLRKNLQELGVSLKKTESFFCPMGEKIGNNTPAEIALSIVAQLLKVRDQVNFQENL